MHRLVAIAALLNSSSLMAQDVHFSQFAMNPTYLNPSLTGNHRCDWRFSGHQRSQWRSVSRPYNTISLSAENRRPLIAPNLYQGGNFVYDAAGDGHLRTVQANLSFARPFLLNSNAIHTIIPGIQLGIYHFGIDISLLSFDNQYNGLSYDPSLPSQENTTTSQRTGFNMALGMAYAFRPDERTEIVAGISCFNIPRPKNSLYGNPIFKRDRRLVLHAKGNYPLNERWDIQPGFLAQFQGTYKEFVIGSDVRYLMDTRKTLLFAPHAGLWLRSGDAVYLTVGARYNQWKAGLSYDINFSKLVPASNLRGGLELSVQYTLCIFKPINRKHRICPAYL